MSDLQKHHEDEGGRYDTGIFLIPVTANGTISEIYASGYCNMAKRENQSFHLTLVIYSYSSERTTYRIPALCNTSTVENENFTIGRVVQPKPDVEISVQEGDTLAIRYNECGKASCPFRPATTNQTSNQEVSFTTMYKLPKLTRETMADSVLGIQFSFSVTKEGKNIQAKFSNDILQYRLQ